ncbi:MAG: hypothetical protein Q9186_004713, partial [Xanthomendoza sp. 1 TL-2023]
MIIFLPILLLFSTPLVTPLYLSPRGAINNDEDWDSAVVKGRNLYAQLQSGCYPDKTDPITREQLVASGYKIGEAGDDSAWPPTFRKFSDLEDDSIKLLRLTEHEKAYWRTTLVRNYGSHGETYYSMEYSPRNGLITAFSIGKAADETVYWSDATFAMWQAVTAFTDTDIRRLHLIGQHDVINVLTLVLLHRLFAGRRDAVIRLLPNTDAFSALVGTPNVAGSVYFLMQHKRQLGFKTIASIVVFGRDPLDWWPPKVAGDGGPDIFLEIRDMPVLRNGGVRNSGDLSLDGIARLCGSRNSTSDASSQ